MTLPTTARIFRGTVGSGRAEGVEVALEIFLPEQVGTFLSAGHDENAKNGAYRAAPLLLVSIETHQSFIAVGQVRILCRKGKTPELQVLVGNLWTREEEFVKKVVGPRGWNLVEDHPDLAAAMTRTLELVSQSVSGSPEAVVTALAKGVAESSRNAVARLRGLRLDQERILGDILQRGTSGEIQRALGDVIEVSLAVSRAREEAREAEREGLWSWTTADAEYRAQRRLMNPPLPPRRGDWRARRTDWFPVLDAGVRQCHEMERQLVEEIASLDNLRNLVTMVTSAREAQSQETFNQLATVAGIALGLPALLLALYGADIILPLRADDWRVLIPLIGAAVLGGIVGFVLPANSFREKALRAVITGTWVLVVVGALTLAGMIVVPKR